MAKDEKKYIVHGARVECSEGTMQNYLNAGTGHGVVYQGQPLLNANDHVPQINLTHFGDCNSKKIYEDAKKKADEKYKADADDGFFMKAGKKLVKTVVKTAITRKEMFSISKCELDTPLPWMFCNDEHMIDGAPALTEDSMCPCRMGGIIKIVREEEASAVTTSVEMQEAMSAAPDKEPSTEVGIVVNKEIIDVIKKAADEILNKAEETKYLRKYVNEETFIKINPNWGENMDRFNNACVEKNDSEHTAFEQLREEMYKYGITDERSILMFISTIGTETGHGKYMSEVLDEGDDAECSYSEKTKGAGLIQLTGELQPVFIDYIQEAEGGGEKVYPENTSEYIANNYPIQSALWFWSVCTEKIAVFGENGGQTNMSINEYIKKYENANQDNLFLAVQYAVNSRQGLSKEKLDIISNTDESVISNGRTYVGEKSADLPEGWESRITDWHNAEKLMEE